MRRILLTLLAISFTPWSTNAQAPLSGLEGSGRTLADGELDTQRGKFVAAGGIRYFGIEMQTRWTDANGVTTAATLLFTLNFVDGDGTGSAVPVLLAGFTRDAESGLLAGAGDPAALDQAGIADTQGALQTVQIAGSRNGAHNAMRISIRPGSSEYSPDTTGLSPLDRGQLVTFSDGDELQFLVAPGQLGLLLTGAGNDHAIQSFGGESGRAAQMVYLASDDNLIANNMNIVIGQDRMTGLTSASVGNSLISLQGL